MQACGSGSSSSISTLDSLDPLSPSSSGYYSPAGSDAPQTPFINDHDGDGQDDICADPREPEAGIYRDRFIDSPVYDRTDSRKAPPSYEPDSCHAFLSPRSSPRYRSFSSLSLATETVEQIPGQDSEENLFDISFGSHMSDEDDKTLHDLKASPRATRTAKIRNPAYNYDAHTCCRHFPQGHQLNPDFVKYYALEDELGSGGYGFVMTAYHRDRGYEVAVKFIIKEKVPDGAWMTDDVLGKLPTEVLLLCFIDHENIVKCLDLYEDDMYYYMIQELHGSPWLNPKLPRSQPNPVIESAKADGARDSTDPLPQLLVPQQRPDFCRRPSHDLFECIEQSDQKRLSEKQARYVFNQVVDAVHYLDVQGVSHRDLKDENIVIDRSFKVKLIDFGSAVVVDPSKPRPYYEVFFGTTAYAASEILQKKPYQAPPAEVWTLGVLLSYLLTGMSPFAKMRDAIEGTMTFCASARGIIPHGAMDLMKLCLDPDPTRRATIAEVKEHPWLRESE
ncbi:hypothetical protein ONZ45_g11321 [Pleurotus djamor]|nr:hypothetical protein ONZ45_g11321 [Pleurotus djamor]